MLGVRANMKQTKLTNACRGKLVLTRAICCFQLLERAEGKGRHPSGFPWLLIV